MRNNENFINVWLQVALMLACIAVVTYLVIVNAAKLTAQTGSSIKVSKEDMALHYAYPLPYGVSDNLATNRKYQINENFMSNYLKNYINLSATDGTLTDYEVIGETYEVSPYVLEDISSNFFGTSPKILNINYDYERDLYIIPKKDLTVEYSLTKVNRTDNYHILIYDEYKTAYKDGNPALSSVRVNAASYYFFVRVDSGDYQVEYYRYYKKDLAPDGYQVVIN